eukprot:223617_1
MHGNNAEAKQDHTRCTNTSCDQIKSVVKALSFRNFVKDQDDFNGHLLQHFEDNPSIINDLHHILINHLNDYNSDVDEQFSIIQKKISKYVKCNIKNCESFKRNQQNNYTQDNQPTDTHSLFYNHILDNIHCLFQHSHDIGYRINYHDMLDSNEENKNENPVTNIDNNMLKMKEHITKIRTTNKISDASPARYTRFGDSLTGNPSKKIWDDEEYPVMNYYELGNTYYFGSENKQDNPQNIGNKKYGSLKDEILNNKICPLRINQFNNSIHKGQMYSSADIIKSMTSNTDALCKKYDIKENTPISLQHIFSIILYCDYQQLHNNLRQAFATYEINTNINEHWNLCKYLREAVECFGNNLVPGKNFYYYLHFKSSDDELNKYYFTNFSLKLCRPTSTTCQLSVAISTCLANNSSNDNGIILQLNKHFTDSLRHLKYIDCSLFSYHSNEDEKLFDGGLFPLNISNITVIKTCKSYERFIHAMSVLDAAVNGQKFETMKNDSHIIDNIFTQKHKKTLPLYIHNIFKSYCNEKDKIIIDLNLDYNFLAHYLFAHSDVVSVTKIVSLFTACVEILIVNKNGENSIDVSYLTQLLLELKNDTSHVLAKSALKQISIINVKLDQEVNDKIFEHFKKDFRDNHFEFIVSTNENKSRDIIIKTEPLTKSTEYKDIFQYVQDALTQMLLRPSTNDNMEHSLTDFQEVQETHQEYKTANDLLNECALCSIRDPKRVYTDCESIKRMKIVLSAYKKYMECLKLWRNVGLQEVLTYNEIYTLTQINDDFIHICDHIAEDDANNDTGEHELH